MNGALVHRRAEKESESVKLFVLSKPVLSPPGQNIKKSVQYDIALSGHLASGQNVQSVVATVYNIVISPAMILFIPVPRVRSLQVFRSVLCRSAPNGVLVTGVIAQ